MKTNFKSRKFLLAGIVVGVFIVSLLGIGFSLAVSANNNNTNYSYAIVEFNDSALGTTGHGHKLDFANLVQQHQHLQTVHSVFKGWMKSNAPWASAISDYYYTLDGVAVQYTGNSLQSLAHGPDVKSVTADWTYKPTMDASVPLIRANQVWSEMGINPTVSTAALAKVKVGVIDTGIDASHPFLASCRAPNSIQHDVFYSGQVDYNPANTIVVAHGTHVAGTIGGCVTSGVIQIGSKSLTISQDQPLSGVAPGVTLHDYNVFPGYGVGYVKGGVAYSHDIINAVEKAVTDGMNIISMSLGGSPQGPHDLLAEAVNNAVDSGVVASVAAGNSGNNPLTIESPGSAANAIAVAASSNAHAVAGTTIQVGTNQIYGVDGEFLTFSPAITASTSLTTPTDGCSAISQDLTGKIAIIDRGTCTFSTKVNNAAAVGAVGVIIVNNQPGAPIAMAISGAQSSIPATMVSLDSGNNILKPFAQNGGTITVDSTGNLHEIPATPDLIADFSSIGPTPYTFLTKPDVAAPGVNIISSVPGGSYAVYDGTSMATPHISGVAALILAGHPNYTPMEVKSAIVNNAVQNDYLNYGSLSGLIYGPLAMGGGRVDAMSAFNANLFSYPSSVSFGGYTGGAPISTSQTVTFTNPTNSPETISLSENNRDGLNNFVFNPKTGYLDLATWQAGNFVSFSSNTLTVQPQSTSSVTISFDAGKTLQTTGWSFGYIEASTGTTTLNIPWSVSFQQHNGAMNGMTGSGFLVDNSIMSAFTNYSNANGLVS